MPRQNLLSHGKTLYRKGMHLRVKPNESENLSEMADRCDNKDALVRGIFFQGIHVQGKMSVSYAGL